MGKEDAIIQYQNALKQGLKEYRECVSREIPPHPPVLDAHKY